MRGPRTAMKSGPRLPQLEKALAQKRRPNTAKKKKKKKYIYIYIYIYIYTYKLINFFKKKISEAEILPLAQRGLIVTD